MLNSPRRRGFAPVLSVGRSRSDVNSKGGSQLESYGPAKQLLVNGVQFAVDNGGKLGAALTEAQPRQLITHLVRPVVHHAARRHHRDRAGPAGLPAVSRRRLEGRRHPDGRPRHCAYSPIGVAKQRRNVQFVHLGRLSCGRRQPQHADGTRRHLDGGAGGTAKDGVRVQAGRGEIPSDVQKQLGVKLK